MTDTWPLSVQLSTARLLLDPLRVEDADELAVLLDDLKLHRFIGGTPDPPDQVRARISYQVRGHSADGAERWFNWVLRPTDEPVVMGQLQATVVPSSAVATLAWLVGSAYQGQGFAREAAAAVAGWVRGFDGVKVQAYIHPEHGASMAIARSLGLIPTGDVVDGEIRWSDE